MIVLMRDLRNQGKHCLTYVCRFFNWTRRLFYCRNFMKIGLVFRLWTLFFCSTYLHNLLYHRLLKIISHFFILFLLVPFKVQEIYNCFKTIQNTPCISLWLMLNIVFALLLACNVILFPNALHSVPVRALYFWSLMHDCVALFTP